MIINIKSGVKPIIKPIARRSCFTPIYEAIDKLKSGQWFEIPREATATDKEEKKIRAAVLKYAKANSIDGLNVGKVSASGAMLVFIASDGLT